MLVAWAEVRVYVRADRFLPAAHARMAIEATLAEMLTGLYLLYFFTIT